MTAEVSIRCTPSRSKMHTSIKSPRTPHNKEARGICCLLQCKTAQSQLDSPALPYDCTWRFHNQHYSSRFGLHRKVHTLCTGWEKPQSIIYMSGDAFIHLRSVTFHPRCLICRPAGASCFSAQSLTCMCHRMHRQTVVIQLSFTQAERCCRVM